MFQQFFGPHVHIDFFNVAVPMPRNPLTDRASISDVDALLQESYGVAAFWQSGRQDATAVPGSTWARLRLGASESVLCYFPSIAISQMFFGSFPSQ